LDAKSRHDSVGGSVITVARGVPKGLGEPIYYKLDAILANAMMSINGTKAVEIGNGIESTKLFGSQNNDEITPDGFRTNNSGGILGGISNGDDIFIKTHFKADSIYISGTRIPGTTFKRNQAGMLLKKGGHDPWFWH